VSALRAIALAVYCVAVSLNWNEPAAASVVLVDKGVLVRVPHDVEIMGTSDKPQGLPPFNKQITRSSKTKIETCRTDKKNYLSAGGQYALWQDMHILPVVRQTRQFGRDNDVVLNIIPQKRRGLTVIFDSVFGLDPERPESPHRFVFRRWMTRVENVEKSSPLVPNGILQIDDKQNRALGLRENVSAVASGVGSLFAGRDRPLHVSSMNFGGLPQFDGSNSQSDSRDRQNTSEGNEPKRISGNSFVDIAGSKNLILFGCVFGGGLAVLVVMAIFVPSNADNKKCGENDEN
jgi:hypothetical protein